MSTSVAVGFERLNAGDTVFVACKNIFVHKNPSLFSAKIKTLKFGDRLNVIGLTKLFTLPASDASSKETLEREEEDDAEQEDREIGQSLLNYTRGPHGYSSQMDIAQHRVL